MRWVGARAAGAVTVAALALAGCAGTVEGFTGAGEGPSVAFLLPESKTSRYEAVDRPVFTAAVARECPECHVVYANAGGDAARQQAQAEAALVQGVDVLVLDAVDGAAARAIVVEAAERGVKVLAYDRFVQDAPLDHYVAYDGVQVGRLQGEALVRVLGEVPDGSGVLMVHGAGADPNAAAIKEGVWEVVRAAGLPVLAEFDTPDWAPDKAQEWVEAKLTELGGRVVGVYAANDGTAGATISALRAAGRVPVPPVTGHDAELAAVQRLVSGDQLMTVHKHIDRQAEQAAVIAVRLARGEAVPGEVDVDGVPSLLLDPEPVVQQDVADLLARGVHRVHDVCTASYRAACEELGLEVPRG
ncbi:substrate-binding domain-containing protein [Cellulomonas bogoriensis]|uniref:ABC transporter substrate-binding protein n=1 Tax=Cellulomonas bogoriensis 69B4 = DSM 16987 TaxID=1386082 RepID=A0A0A0BJY0_9CELL|nr:substrate-binding domain-containing protein [Cellulomonas bogoriensis]KGM08818.1 ABC transporter substrate-binding protein [Cellulomonas bogoriensis 69B4 = DSM 16987]